MQALLLPRKHNFFFTEGLRIEDAIAAALALPNRRAVSQDSDELRVKNRRQSRQHASRASASREAEFTLASRTCSCSAPSKSKAPVKALLLSECKRRPFETAQPPRTPRLPTR